MARTVSPEFTTAYDRARYIKNANNDELLNVGAAFLPLPCIITMPHIPKDCLVSLVNLETDVTTVVAALRLR